MTIDVSAEVLRFACEQACSDPLGQIRERCARIARLRAEKGAAEQAIGRSRGGRGTKIHLVVDGAGRVLTFVLTAGQKGYAPRALGRLADWRRIHTRYDKLAQNFASAVAIAAIIQGWC